MMSYAWRAITSVMTAFYLLLSVGACSVQPTDNNVFTPVYDVPIGQSAVSILQCDPTIGRALQLVTDRYARSLGTSHAFTVQTVSGSDYRAALHSRLMAGESVDLFSLGGVDDVARLQPWLQDMSAMPWVFDAVPGTLDAVTADGMVYGAPYNYEGVGFVVNRDIFAAAGITLEEIRDFESMSEAFFALRDKIDAGDLAESYPDLVAVADIAVQDSDYMGGQFAELMLAGSYASPARALDSAPAMPDAAGVEELVTLLARVSPQRTGWTDFATVTDSQMIEGGIAAERVAAVLYRTGAYRRILETNPDMQGKLELLPVYLPDYEQGVVFAGPSWWWGMRAEMDDSARELAGGLLEWLYRSEDGAEVLQEEFAALSPYQTGAVSRVRLDQDLLRLRTQEQVLPRLAPQAPHRWGSDVFTVQMQSYFTVYQMEWADVVAECKTGWAELLE